MCRTIPDVPRWLELSSALADSCKRALISFQLTLVILGYKCFGCFI